MEAKLWIPFLFVLSVLMPTTSADSIEPMSPIAATFGSEINITCDATITSAVEGIKLKKITDAAGTEERIVQLMPPNFDQPPDQPLDNPAKYQLTKTSLHGFYITIKDVAFEDAARYKCQLVSDDRIVQTTTLVIVRTPTLQMMDKIQAEQATSITCDAEYQVPVGLDESTETNRFPKLSGSVDGVWLKDGIEVRTEKNIKITWNTTLAPTANEKPLVCKVFTDLPSYELTTTKTLNILFDMQNINLANVKETYVVGDEINCTADGNPAPEIRWTANTTNRAGVNVYSHNLLITDTMMGEKQESWKCVAESSTTGKKIETTPIKFTVIRAPVPTTGPLKESPTAAIVAGVTVPLVIIIAVVVVVIVVLMRKKKQKPKPPPGDAEGTISSGPFTNPVAPDDNQHNKPSNKITAYQSEKPSLPPHEQPYQNSPNHHNVGYEPSQYDEELRMDKSAELARRALTPLPMEDADYDIPYNDERGRPRLADVASHVAPPGGPPPRGLPPDQQYSVVHRPPPTPTDYPDMAAAHPGLQQVYNSPKPPTNYPDMAVAHPGLRQAYNMPKPRAVPREPADTTV